MKRFANDRVAGLMERLGLEEDVAIESRLVSKTIESAQSRVEGFNFDIRKRVVEFDDVINKQRETIYAERDKVLRNEDLGETIVDLLDQEVDALVDQFSAARSERLEPRGRWPPPSRRWASTATGPPRTSCGSSAAARPSPSTSTSSPTRSSRRRRRRSARPTGRLIERLVLLRTIDSLWVEHLTELDDMRRGIGLRGYAQQDPLNEFRREAFALYTELRDFIRHQLASTIFRVTVTRSAAAAGDAARRCPTPRRWRPSAMGPARTATDRRRGGSRRSRRGGRPAAAGVARGLPAGPAVRGVRESLGDEVVGAAGRAVAARAAAPPGLHPSGDRIGRNDACFCGSGLKYKRCHGE